MSRLVSRENLKLGVVAVFCLLLAWTGPAIAHGVHAQFAHNADKVDGRHAVGAGAGLTTAKDKLVAHGGDGRIPEKFLPPTILRGPTILTSHGGGGWRPDSGAMSSSVSNHGTFVAFTGGGGGFLPLAAPVAIGSAGYQPTRVEVCFATEGLARIDTLSLRQSAPGAGDGTTRWVHVMNLSTDGGTACVWRDVTDECAGVGTCVGTFQRGGSLLVTTSGTGTVKLGGVRVRWSRQ